MAQARVNTSSGAGDASSATIAAGAASHTTGNSIYVAVFWSGNVNANVPTDTALNTYVSTGLKGNNGTTDHVEIFRADNITGNASNVVTGNFASGTTFRRIGVHQISGSDTTNSFDTGSSGTGTGTTASTGGWTPAQADEYGFGGASGSSGPTMTGGGSYTKVLSAIGSDSNTEERIISAIAAQAPTFTWAGSITWWMAAASFKAAGGGGAATVKQLSALGVG